MFGWEFPPHISGGLGTACYGLTKGLSSLGVNILFVVPKVYGDEDQNTARIIGAGDVVINQKTFNFEDIWKEITFLEVGSVLVPYLSPEEFDKLSSTKVGNTQLTGESDEFGKIHFTGLYGNSLFREVSNYAVIAAYIASQYEFDVIHAHDWLTYAAGIAAKRVSGKPLVIHVHATEFDRSGDNVNQNVYDIERAGMHAADKIIAVSNYTRNIIIERYGIDPAKVVVIYNAVEHSDDSDYIDRRKSVPEKIVTFLGRVTFQKGPEYFVEAAYKVSKRLDNVRFVMAGSGDMLNRMIRRVAELRMSSIFHFPGFLRGDEVDRMFSMSDVYVMPSVSEPFGISPLEAMRSSVPVIISKQSGVSEILHHAIKVDFWDIDSIADSIHALITYDGISKMFRKYGKNEVDKLKWENAAAQVRDVYFSVVNK